MKHRQLTPPARHILMRAIGILQEADHPQSQITDPKDYIVLMGSIAEEASARAHLASRCQAPPFVVNRVPDTLLGPNDRVSQDELQALVRAQEAAARRRHPYPPIGLMERFSGLQVTESRRYDRALANIAMPERFQIVGGGSWRARLGDILRSWQLSLAIVIWLAWKLSAGYVAATGSYYGLEVWVLCVVLPVCLGSSWLVRWLGRRL